MCAVYLSYLHGQLASGSITVHVLREEVPPTQSVKLLTAQPACHLSLAEDNRHTATQSVNQACLLNNQLVNVNLGRKEITDRDEDQLHVMHPTHSNMMVLKEQRLDIDEVISTIQDNINQERSDLHICIPELKSILYGLIEDHISFIKYLGSMLGGDHPWIRSLEQESDKLIDEINETMHQTNVIIRMAESDWEVYAADHQPEQNVTTASSRPETILREKQVRKTTGTKEDRYIGTHHCYSSKKEAQTLITKQPVTTASSRPGSSKQPLITEQPVSTASSMPGSSKQQLIPEQPVTTASSWQESSKQPLTTQPQLGQEAASSH